MHPEQKAFEDNIDRDPTDSTNHLVYADWLDDHDQPEEAAFRRNLGNWFQQNRDFGEGKNPHSRPNSKRGRSYQFWAVDPRHLPEGIDRIELARTSDYTPGATGRLLFNDYRRLENGLRSAFNKGQQPNKLSRLISRRLTYKRKV